jgi:hypothetical protein
MVSVPCVTTMPAKSSSSAPRMAARSSHIALDGHVRAGVAAELAHLHGGDRLDAGDAGQDLAAAQAGDGAAQRGVRAHGDGAAGGQQQHAREPTGRVSHRARSRR